MVIRGPTHPTGDTMTVRKTPSGRFEAPPMVNGVRYTSTQPTREDADDWLTVIRARAVTGGLLRPPRTRTARPRA
jgi:hypothetical protein